MNERIKQLAEQAGLGDNKFNEAGIISVYGNFDLEKFADLIIRECMTQIEEVKQIRTGHAGPEYTQGFDDGMFVAIRTIEEHFGVEE